MSNELVPGLNGDFKKLMVTRFLFTFGVQMQAVILGWRMYELTHDALFLGLIGLTEAIPAIGLALHAGYIVDRSRPLVVYRNVLLGSLLSGVVLLLSQMQRQQMAVNPQIIALFASAFITGAARGFSGPSLYATVPRILERAHLPQASAWMSGMVQLARVSGPAIGGLVFGWYGMTAASALICALLVFSLGAHSLIKIKIPAPGAHSVKPNFQTELLAGLKFVFSHKILLPALSLDMISVLFGGVTAILPIYAAEILFVGPRGLGLLRAAPGFGAVLTSLVLSQRKNWTRAGHWLLTSVAGFGVCILIFGLSKSYYVSLLALGVSGAFDAVSMLIRGVAVQLSSPDAMRGRVSAVNSMFIGSSNEIGEFESGLAARLLGTVPSVIFGGVACLVTVAAVTLSSSTLRQMDLTKLNPDS